MKCLYDASLLRERCEAMERYARAHDRHHVAMIERDYPERTRQQVEMADAFEEASVLKARICQDVFESIRLLIEFDRGQTVELFRPIVEEILEPEFRAIDRAIEEGRR